jgi:hypothetical protein
MMNDFENAYTVDCNGVYKGCVQVQLCPVSKKEYLLPSNAVLEKPPEYDSNKNYVIREETKWVVRPRLSLSEYRNNLIDAANFQCQTAIFDKYPLYKQNNIINEALVCGDKKEAKAMHSFISEKRASCNAIKEQIMCATQYELEAIENNLTNVEAK